MKKIGITGVNGFIGYHLKCSLSNIYKNFNVVKFERKFFNSETLLDQFVKECDVIIHVAGINRHEDSQVIYKLNVSLVEKLINSLKKTASDTHVIFTSSIQENSSSDYGRAKKKCREEFSKWANNSNSKFTGLLIPNVFGPFCKPNYNSVVSTFSENIINNKCTNIIVDKEISLIYVAELVHLIVDTINNEIEDHNKKVSGTFQIKVSALRDLLNYYKESYIEKGEIPSFKGAFDLNLFNTFRSYIDIENFFPRKLVYHTDERGSFSEIIKISSGGQMSFSTTKAGVTRGNHFHTRKIERFAVIKGNAEVNLRKVGSKKNIKISISETNPGYVDIPIWYTHNLKNVGTDELYVVFWISEKYDPIDSDTYFMDV